MTKELTIEVIYNNTHGGFHKSRKAMDLYNEKMSKLDKNFKPIEQYSYDWRYIKRHDPVLIEVFNELGNEFNGGSYSNAAITNIPKKFQDSYEISEYDGLERIWINLEKYKNINIKKIIENTELNNDTKIDEIKKILLERESNNYRFHSYNPRYDFDY